MIDDHERANILAAVLAKLEATLPSWRPTPNPNRRAFRVDFLGAIGFVFVDGDGRTRVSSDVHPLKRASVRAALGNLFEWSDSKTRERDRR